MEQSYRPDKDLRDSMVVISSTTTALGTNLTLTDSILTQGASYWVNMSVVILSGNSIGQIRRISAFTTPTITVDTAFASVIASGTKYNIIAQHAPASGAITPVSATDKGVRQIFEKTITAATNAGATVLGTITTQACMIESIVIYTNAALEANTTCAVTGGAGAVTFIDAGAATAQALTADGNQVAWTGAVRLAATKTIITTLSGGAGAASDLVFIITYYSSSANGGTIV